MWGATIKPSVENDMMLLTVLEDTMQQYDGDGVRVGYTFTEDYNDPTPGEDSGLSNIYIGPVSLILAGRVATIFQCAPPVQLIRGAYQTLLKATWESTTPKGQYTDRTPIGSGNNRFGLVPWKFFPKEKQITVEVDTQLDDLTIEEDNFTQ